MLHEWPNSDYDFASESTSSRTKVLKKSTSKHFLISTCVIIVLVVVYASYWVSTSLSAEHTYQAQSVVLRILTRYIETHPGKWPSDWNELEKVDLPDQRGMYVWPNDIEAIRKRVSVNFHLQIVDIENMTTDNFSAIEQKEPNYGINEGLARALIDAAK